MAGNRKHRYWKRFEFASFLLKFFQKQTIILVSLDWMHSNTPFLVRFQIGRS